jgi:hypothetical protein
MFLFLLCTTCLFFLQYYILHLFLITSCLFFFITGDWAKMAGDCHRSVASVYQRHPPVAEPLGAGEEQPGPSDRRTRRRGRGGHGNQSSSRAASSFHATWGGGGTGGHSGHGRRRGVGSIDGRCGRGGRYGFRFLWFVEALLARSLEPPFGSTSTPATSDLP